MPVLKVFKDGAWQNITSDGVSSWNDLTDKPFYDTIEKGDEIFAISYDFVAGNHGEIFYSEDSVLEITENETYFIDYDGTTYECVAYLANGGSDDEPNYLPVIGNVEIVGLSGGNAEPFFIGTDRGEIFVYVQTEGTHDVALYTSIGSIKKIDSKYLPASYGNSWDDLTNKPFEVPTIYYEWNCQENYRNKIELPNDMGTYVKISDEVPESSDFFVGKYFSGTIYVRAGSGGGILSGENEIKERDINIMPESDNVYLVRSANMVVASLDYTISEPDGGFTATFTKGVWFLDPSSTGFNYINARIINTPTKKINDIVIPDTIARTAQLEDLITYGEDDLISGESKLDTGTLYFVYE